MKKLLGILILTLFVTQAQSQVLISLLLGDKLNSEGMEFGLTGGYNWSNISNMESTKRFSNFNLGFYFDIRIKDQLWLNTGVLVKSKLGLGKLTPGDLDFLGATTYPQEGDYNQSISYFLVPALAKYKFPNHFYVEAGPQFGLGHKSWVEFVEKNDELTATIREFNKEKINRIDAGVRAGVGYKLMKGTGMNIGLAYYYGFANAYKGVDGSNNQSLFLKLDVPIGRKKTENAED